jgi:hypothetical protein
MAVAMEWNISGVVWTMLWFAIFFIWIWILISVFADIFRSHDMSGAAKALWIIFVVLLPYLGVFIYLVARGGGMAQRNMEAAQQQDAAMRSYVRDAAGSSGGTAEELEKLAALKDKGVITDDEFAAQKAKLLSS